MVDGPLLGAPINFPQPGPPAVACCPPLLSPLTGGGPPFMGGTPPPYSFVRTGTGPSVVLDISVLNTDAPPIVTILPGFGDPTINGVVFTSGGGSGGMDLLEIDLDTTPMGTPGFARIQIENECGCVAQVSLFTQDPA
jgi:hypothetical protein